MFWLWLIAAFIGGTFFAVILLAFFIGANWSQRNEED